jgi:hypothetical protein
MIRSTLYQLSAFHSAKITLPVAMPASVVLSGNISRLPFSTNPGRRDDELYNKNFSGAFDESDALEVGKTANLADGVLILMAPKLEKEILKEPKHTIAITENSPTSMTDEEVTQKNYSDAFDESDFAEMGKVGHEKEQ